MSQPSVTIDVGLVKGLIAQQFPQWSGLTIAPVVNSGWDNRTFHLGERLSVRLPSAEVYAAAVVKEQTWLPQLAPHLPLPIPKPVAMGQPCADFPWAWSVYQWLDGDVASAADIGDLSLFAADLAHFLQALGRIDTQGAPHAGPRGFRGGRLDIWDAQARQALDVLVGTIDTVTAKDIWENALQAPMTEPNVWYHGDVAAGNLLCREGRLSAVIDFGGVAVGDPACDLVIAWTFFDGPSRAAFRSALGASDALWARGQGWALWKAMIILAELIQTNAIEAGSAQRAVDELLTEYSSAKGKRR